ncbi:MAG: hypothetical protein ACLQVN_24755 [Bryobacteraceae bacterium]
MKNGWETFLKLVPLVAVVVAMVGWFAGSWLNAGRDRVNKLREIRLQYEIATYRMLALAAQRKPEPGSRYFRDMEAAVADIQLFGTESQVRGVDAFLREFRAKGKGSFNDLLRDLRSNLRKELELAPVASDVQWFRPEGGAE